MRRLLNVPQTGLPWYFYKFFLFLIRLYSVHLIHKGKQELHFI